jgi:hypothetical protein
VLRGGLPGLEVDGMQTAIYAEERMFRRYAFLLPECDHSYGTLREGQVSYGCKKDAYGESSSPHCLHLIYFPGITCVETETI